MSRAVLPWVALAAVVLAWAGSCSFKGSGADAVAALRVELADSFAAVADSLARENQADSAALADSAAVWAARIDQARAARADAEARARGATRRAQVARDSLVARLDSTEVAMLGRYIEERDSIDAATDAVLDSYRTELATVTAQRDALELAVVGLRAEVVARTAENVQLRAAVEALEARVRDLEPSGLERIMDLGEKGLAGKALLDMATS